MGKTLVLLANESRSETQGKDFEEAKEAIKNLKIHADQLDIEIISYPGTMGRISEEDFKKIIAEINKKDPKEFDSLCFYGGHGNKQSCNNLNAKQVSILIKTLLEKGFLFDRVSLDFCHSYVWVPHMQPLSKGKILSTITSIPYSPMEKIATISNKNHQYDDKALLPPLTETYAQIFPWTTEKNAKKINWFKSSVIRELKKTKHEKNTNFEDYYLYLMHDLKTFQREGKLPGCYLYREGKNPRACYS